MRFVGDQRELGSAGSAPFQRLSVFEGCVCTGCLSEGCIGAALSCRAQFQRNWASLQANLQGLLANPPLFGKLSTGQFSKFTLCGAHCVWRFRPLRRATRGSARLAPLTSGPRKPLKRLDLNFYIIIVPTLCELLYEAVEYRTIYPARSLRLLFSQPSPSIAHICASRATIANWQRKHSASARRSNRWEMYMHNLLYVRVR